MDHRFSKHEYFINCAFTLLYTGLVAGAYTDISSCPYTYDTPTDVSLRFAEATTFGKGHANPGQGGVAMITNGFSNVYTHSFERCSVASQKHLFSALGCGNGLSCHMLDIIVWAYIIGLLVFMTQKYIAYRIQGLHYFFLDYCYFHSFVMTVFLLYCLVEVTWSTEPLVRWRAHTGAASSDAINATLAAAAARNPLDLAFTSATHNPVKDGLIQMCHQFWQWVRGVDGIYYPTSVNILTCGYAMAHHIRDHAYLVFLALLGGAFGPLLGAIIMWRNALLFHSFDRMSSCYLHLLPGIVQGLLLHRLFISARNEARLLDPEAIFVRAVQLAWRTNQTVESWLPAVVGMKKADGWSPDMLPSAELAQQRPREAQKALEAGKKAYGEYARRSGYGAWCGHGTHCFAMEETVTFGNVLRLHFYMFMVWQVFYHTFHESRRRVRMMKERRRRIKATLAEHAETMALAGSTAEETELLKPPTTLAEGAGGDPTFRVTSYTWMFEHPPGGKKGLPYRFCTMFGMGRFPTTVLFQISQWIIHMIFFTLTYPLIYLTFHRVHNAWPLLLQCVVYTLLCVYNAACVDKKWIGKLQKMSQKGLESERLRLSMVQPPPGSTPSAAAGGDDAGDAHATTSTPQKPATAPPISESREEEPSAEHARSAPRRPAPVPGLADAPRTQGTHGEDAQAANDEL